MAQSIPVGCSLRMTYTNDMAGLRFNGVHPVANAALGSAATRRRAQIIEQDITTIVLP